MYDVTITVPADDVRRFVDEEKAIALAGDLVTRTQAYEDRLAQPSLDPS